MPRTDQKVKTSQVWKLDGGDLAKIAKRVKRSISTLRRWKREGIPDSSREVVIRAIIRARKAPKRPSKPKGLTAREAAEFERLQRKINAAEKPIRKPRSPTRVPLTRRERAERKAQLKIVREMETYLRQHHLAEEIRHTVPGVRDIDGRMMLNREALAAMIERDDYRWKAFVKICSSAGLDYADIRNVWFSPKANRSMQGGAL